MTQSSYQLRNSKHKLALPQPKSISLEEVSLTKVLSQDLYTVASLNKFKRKL